MAAPVASTRLMPVGKKLGDGFKSLIVFAGKRDLAIWEKTVKPMGFDGGPANATTTMHSSVWVTKSPSTLIEATDVTVNFEFDPAVKQSLIDLLNVPTTITVVHPDNAKDAFYGYMQKVDFDAYERGKAPTGTMTIVPTMQDPSTCEEQGPTFVAATGTASAC